MAETHLSLEEVARYPRPGTQVPRRLTFMPDGRQIAYLFSAADTLVQDLWTYDIQTGERRQVTDVAAGAPPLGRRSLDEDLRRERRRIREEGVTAYQVGRAGADGPPLLLIPLDGRLYLARDADAPVPLAGIADAVDARPSPDGAYVAYVRAGELFVRPLSGDAAPRRLTEGARNGVTNGLAEYIAEEEMDRHAGYWWSPDSARLAYVRANSSTLPTLTIVHQGLEPPLVETAGYPFAGGPNAVVRLGVVPRDGNPGDVTWMDLGTNDDIYLARVAWRPDGSLTALVQSRDQRTLRLLAFDGASGAATTLIEEHNDLWLDLHDDTRFLRTGEILWSCQTSGFRHLALHAADGREIRVLTAGDWTVTGGVAVDEERRLVYFQGTADGVLERHLYAVSLDGGPLRRLTSEPGWHDTVVSPEHGYFVDIWSSVDQAPRVTLRRLVDGERHAVLWERPELNAAALGLCLPELTSFPAEDGATLHAAVYAPEETRASGHPHPLLVAVYGGPTAQMVVNAWSLTVDLRAQYLAQHGFVVLKVDNRGSGQRGLAFQAPVAGRLGPIEVADQVAGVRFLADRPYVDGARVGIYGWSYGGYMTCLALLLAPDVFTAGVAGAPVTFWEGYDTHFTERYMGTPAGNAVVYQASAVLTHVEALRGSLLLVHGLVDENVHARHTLRLIGALAAAARPYELLLFPEERHMVRDPRNLEYLERRLTAFLREHLAADGE